VKKHIESFDGAPRDECLNVHQFVSRDDARNQIESSRIDYNGQGQHSAPGNMRPSEFSTPRQGKLASEAAKV
jgi:putative transposase